MPTFCDKFGAMKRLAYFLPDAAAAALLLWVSAPLFVVSFTTIPDPPCWFRPAELYTAKPVVWSSSHSLLLLVGVLLTLGWVVARRGFWTKPDWNKSWIANAVVWIWFIPLIVVLLIAQSSTSFEVHGGCIQLGGPEFDAYNSADLVVFMLVLSGPVLLLFSAIMTTCLWASIRFAHPSHAKGSEKDF